MTEAVMLELERLGLRPGPEELRRLEAFAAALLERNSVQNLVSRKDEPLLWERHILDSLAAAAPLRRLLKPGAAVADAGSGAGFPGLALAAVLPEFGFELLDSRAKRVEFLAEAAAAMGAGNVKAFQRRVGEGGPGSERRYGAVIERAMGQLENILPQCLNITERGGYFLAWQSAAQMAAARPAVDAALAKAGGTLSGSLPYRLPGEAADRHILVFRKN